MTTSESIIIGVVSGLLSSFLLFLLGKFIRTVLIPWYQNLIYNGTNIEGNWVSTAVFPTGTQQDSTVIIKQNATKITATVTAIKSKNGQNIQIKTFALNGFIKERFVHLHGQNIDNKQIGILSMLWEVTAEGNRLEGVDCWYDVGSCKITSDKTVWTRDIR